jgi:glutaredoxin
MLAVVSVVLYSKPDCHLCDVLKEAIDAVAKRRSFDLTIVDIRTNPEAFAKYETEIPVVAVNGRKVARYRLSERAFEAALDAAANAG